MISSFIKVFLQNLNRQTDRRPGRVAKKSPDLYRTWMVLTALDDNCTSFNLYARISFNFPNKYPLSAWQMKMEANVAFTNVFFCQEKVDNFRKITTYSCIKVKWHTIIIQSCQQHLSSIQIWTLFCLTNENGT